MTHSEDAPVTADAALWATGTTTPLTRAERLELLDATRLYVCTNAREERGDLREFLAAAYAGGVGIVQLRDKGMEAGAEIERVMVLADVAREQGMMFSVNDRADVAALTGADVLHLGQGDLSTSQARALLGPEVLIGRSTRSLSQINEANQDPGIDYFCVGPVWETPTKPGRAAVGLDLLGYAAAVAKKPWFAIGGIDAQRLPQVVEAGAERVVVVRAVTEAEDPAAAARELLAGF
ncbi:thiamine phosphate synthase [Zhihengliuella halotolerans]|uniref:Thiamine-phosphate synthase n=1 Tax=Zhihengliuella halotolerans TaxID=370736 RepID=A0A4Q8AG64_9MICC|nr:thiamine phosphate synthase [Zhihengliuella halotolerans]RZU62735.1 thiamine-phosphate pyrophosphorylase [Zhihengliuella halotolerans]